MNPNLNGETIAPTAQAGTSLYRDSVSDPQSQAHSAAGELSQDPAYIPQPSSPQFQKSPQTGTMGASIPINLYRELVAELQHTQNQLKVMGDRNETLAQHNQQLRAEIAQLVQAVLQVRHAANVIQPEAPIMPELDKSLNHAPLQSDSSQAATSSQSLEEALAEAIARQSDMMPYGQAPSNVTLDSSGSSGLGASVAQSASFSVSSAAKTGSIKMPSHPHPRPIATVQSRASQARNTHRGSATAPVFRGWGIVAVVAMVIVTGFGMGFATTLWMQSRSSSTSN